MRTIRRSAALGLPVVLLTAGALAAPAAAPPKPASPTQVLAQLASGGGNGNVYIASGPLDSTDADRAGDHSLAPYLYVDGGDPETERLPLRETSAQVNVAGVIAHVAVRQVFENAGKKPIEAVYVFPASTRAAVHGMRMKIGQRVVEAKIDRRAAARATYEAARAAGKRTSLLEQERPNVFTMNVANIMPGDRIEVQLDYSELLVPEDATYELVFPTVVGPRYTGGADPQKDQWMANPHLAAGAPSPTKFDIGVHLETGVGIKEMSSPSHAVDIAYASANIADVKLRDRDGMGGNRDFVLRYRLAGDKIESGILLSPRGPDGEGYFALMMEPPRRPTAAQIPAREYIFLLDVSGSMHGFPLDTAKELMRHLLGQLSPTDQFDVALFSGANYVWSPGGSVPATPGNIRDAVDLIEKQHGGGGTELMGGLRASYAIPRKNRQISRTVVVVTDGYVGVEAEAFRFIRERLDDANLFAFGIGSSVNRALIEGMARAGRGEPFVVLKPEKARAEADRLRTYIEQPVLTHVGVGFEGLHTTEVSPAKLPDLLARRPLVLFGKYQGEPGGQVRVTGFGGGGAPFSQVMPVRPADARPRNEALRWLWARSWVATLEDERHMGGGKVVEDAITDLGLRHSLLTPFTSFVAVDHEIVNTTGQSTNVRQPLPMPQGVSNLAVGQEMAPMKSTMGLGGVGSGGGAMGLIGGKGRSAAPMAARKKSVSDEPLDGLFGSSSRHAAPAAPVAEAAPPPPRTMSEESDSDKEDDEKAAAPRRLVATCATVGATGLASPEALLAAVKARLATVSWAAVGARPGALVLALTVDAGGKVVGVQVMSGEASLATFLKAKLVGMTSGARPTGTKAGTWVVKVRIESR